MLLSKNMIPSAIKGISWFITTALATFTGAYLLTGSVKLSTMICGLSSLIQIPAYRGWRSIVDRFAAAEREPEAFVLWLTGLSGAGKSALADAVYDYLIQSGRRVSRLDGDTVRSVFPNTGFTREERNAHIQRVGYLASILEQNGVIVISSFVSPYIESRDFVRGLCRNFIEVYINTPLAECERRDVKGLYKQARAGAIRNFTGIDDPYEPPKNPELVIRTENRSVGESAGEIISYIGRHLARQRG